MTYDESLSEQCLREAVQLMLKAAKRLDDVVEYAEEGSDVSLAVNASVWLKHRADHLMPAQDGWPKGPGLAEIIDMATWRRKA